MRVVNSASYRRAIELILHTVTYECCAPRHTKSGQQTQWHMPIVKHFTRPGRVLSHKCCWVHSPRATRAASGQTEKRHKNTRESERASHKDCNQRGFARANSRYFTKKHPPDKRADTCASAVLLHKLGQVEYDTRPSGACRR